MQTDTGPVVVEKVTSEKDLGVTFDQKLKFTDHINNKVNKANRNVGLIFRTFTFMNKEMFLNLYKSIVRPHLEYASTVWSSMFKKDKILIENVQRRATRLVKSIKHLPYEDRLKTLYSKRIYSASGIWRSFSSSHEKYSKTNKITFKRNRLNYH